VGQFHESKKIGQGMNKEIECEKVGQWMKVKFIRKDRDLTFSHQRFLDFIPLLPTFSQLTTFSSIVKLSRSLERFYIRWHSRKLGLEEA